MTGPAGSAAGPVLSAVLKTVRSGRRLHEADVLLVPPRLAEIALTQLGGHHSDPIGAVVSLHRDSWWYGFFLAPAPAPAQEPWPLWPDVCRYLPACVEVDLPAHGDRGGNGTFGWVRHGTRDRLYSKPLPLYAALTSLDSISRQNSAGTGPVLRTAAGRACLVPPPRHPGAIRALLGAP
ncbi:hypothetical protein [Streptomyces sp. NPDC091278]|uniref:hypothetical protein n=1 Tax=Streptomyces sp. NPDC091278 TaxID=3155301 RepID=UPI0034507EAA